MIGYRQVMIYHSRRLRGCSQNEIYERTETWNKPKIQNEAEFLVNQMLSGSQMLIANWCLHRFGLFGTWEMFQRNVWFLSDQRLSKMARFQWMTVKWQLETFKEWEDSQRSETWSEVQITKWQLRAFNHENSKLSTSEGFSEIKGLKRSADFRQMKGVEFIADFKHTLEQRP